MLWKKHGYCYQQNYDTIPQGTQSDQSSSSMKNHTLIVTLGDSEK